MTPGFGGSVSRAARSRLPSTSATAPFARPRDVGTHSTARSPSSPRRRLHRRRLATCLPARALHPDGARAHRRARRLAAFPAAIARAFPRPCAKRGLLRRTAPAGCDHEDGQHTRASSARRGGLAPTQASALERRREVNRPRSGRVRMRARAGSTHAGTRSRVTASGARSSPSRLRASSQATAGHWRQWSSCSAHRSGEESAPAQRREERSAAQL